MLRGGEGGEERTSLLVRRDGGGESDSRRSSSSRGDSEGCSVEDEAEHLTLGGTGVADHEDVDISTNVGSVREVLLHAAEEKEEDRLLDVVVSVDRGSERLREELEDVLLLADLVDPANVGVGQDGLGDAAASFGGEEDEVVRHDESPARSRVSSLPALFRLSLT